MKFYLAHFRHRRDGTLDDTFVNIHAASFAEARRLAKNMVGEDDKTWLYKISADSTARFIRGSLS